MEEVKMKHRSGHHMESASHKKHHGHKEAHLKHERERHAKMEKQHSHGRGVHAHGPDYQDSMSVSDNHQQGIGRVMQKKEEMEVGQGGKMHWSPEHRADFHRGGMTPRKG